MAKIIRRIISVLFGNYPQDDGTVKPIEWQVLKQEGNKALLISKFGLEECRFDEKTNVWADSEIRHWLNNEFLNSAFTEGEKVAILETELQDEETTDKVFLLSREEAKTLFKCDEERRLNVWWWLRSPSRSQDLASGVYFDGSLSRYDVNFDYGVARPALWVNLDSEIFES